MRALSTANDSLAPGLWIAGEVLDRDSLAQRTGPTASVFASRVSQRRARGLHAGRSLAADGFGSAKLRARSTRSPSGAVALPLHTSARRGPTCAAAESS